MSPSVPAPSQVSSDADRAFALGCHKLAEVVERTQLVPRITQLAKARSPQRLFLVDGTPYVGDADGLFRIDRATGARTLVDTHGSTAVAFDGAHVVWLGSYLSTTVPPDHPMYLDSLTQTSTVIRVAAPSPSAGGASERELPSRLRLDTRARDLILLGDRILQRTGQPDVNISAHPLDGSPLTAVLEGHPLSALTLSGLGLIALDEAGSVLRVPLDGTVVEHLVETHGAGSIASHAGGVVWYDSTTHVVSHWDAKTRAVVSSSPVERDGWWWNELCTDGAHAYGYAVYDDAGCRQVQRIDLDGTHYQPLLRVRESVISLVTDDSGLYILASDGVYHVSK